MEFANSKLIAVVSNVFLVAGRGILFDYRACRSGTREKDFIRNSLQRTIVRFETSFFIPLILRLYRVWYLRFGIWNGRARKKKRFLHIFHSSTRVYRAHNTFLILLCGDLILSHNRCNILIEFQIFTRISGE